jgi:hypothetical protein
MAHHFFFKGYGLSSKLQEKVSDEGGVFCFLLMEELLHFDVDDPKPCRLEFLVSRIISLDHH